MTQLIPNRLLVAVEIRLNHRSKLPRLTGKLTDWSDEFLLPNLCEMDGQEPFAKVYACWNDEGIAFACKVQCPDKKFRCDPASFWKGDNLRICTDMRDTRDIHRATRYCQQFFVLPTGGGKMRSEAIGGSSPIHRAKENASPIKAGMIPVAANITKRGYSIEAILPASLLSGFDPAEHPRIGFYYMLEDLALGQQYLTVGDDLYWHVDPSMWATAVLAR
ncbi:MAG: hypothetical protein DHS20C16_30950 [Phycisphaerae bacterium]|nr:MAG: hypothetical protein DHS20C16_30950 [Phycisphaerae bacterium]